MPVTRTLSNGNQLIDWTDEIIKVDNQAGLIGSMNLFRTTGTSQTAIMFDKSYNDITLLPQTSRMGGQPTKGSDRKVDTFSLGLSYFKAVDYITNEDLQGIRMAGTPDQVEMMANKYNEKLEDLRARVDQTHEYMKLQAAKGVMKTPDGAVIADMFSEFGIVQEVMNFELGTNTTDVNKKISELKRYLQKNLKTGGTIQGINVVVDTEWFDKFVSHPTIREAYLQRQQGFNPIYDNTNQFMSFGSVDQWTYKGITFMTYDHTFKLPDGTTENAVDTNTGHVIPVVRDLFRGYYGPSKKLSGANQVGKEMFAYEWTDPRDEYKEFEVETSPLYFATQPQVLVKLTTN